MRRRDAPTGASGDTKVDAGALRAAARDLGVALSDDQVERLAAFGAMLLHWNRTYNLTSIRDVDDTVSLHLADCLAAVPPLRRHLDDARPGGRSPRPSLLDVGSGGGLPGVVLAIAIPELDVTCVDAVGKKAAFVRQVAGELALSNVNALHSRAEQVDGQHDVVASRAFATLGDTVAATAHLLSDDGVWMAMKGRRPDDEIAQVPGSVDVFHVEPLSVPGLEAERCLVWMRKRR
jgi:16S rRNA (guanine527-N7)-methyltransferase